MKIITNNQLAKIKDIPFRHDLHYKKWDWISKHPDKDSFEWYNAHPRWKRLTRSSSGFACEYVRQVTRKLAGTDGMLCWVCPFKFTWNKSCLGGLLEDCLYNAKDRVKRAEQIRDLPLNPIYNFNGEIHNAKKCRIIEPHSSESHHVFTFSDGDPAVTRKTIEMLGTGTYGPGFTVDSPELKADFFFCTLLEYLDCKYQDQVCRIDVIQNTIKINMINEIRNIRKNISDTFAKHNVNVIFNTIYDIYGKDLESDESTTICIDLAGVIDCDGTFSADDMKLIEMAYNPEMLFRFIYNDSKVNDLN